MIKGYPVRRKLQHLIKRFFKTFSRLLRQPVNQIHVDGMKTRFTRSLHRIASHLKGLNAVDSLLHVRIKILHPAAHTVQTYFSEGLNFLRRTSPGVNLNREFPSLFQRETTGDQIHHPFNFLIIEKGGRASTEVKLTNRCLAADFSLNQFNFFVENIQVLGTFAVVTRHLLIASAIKANVIAKWNVHVQGERFIRLTISESFLVIVRCKVFIKAVCGRVRRVARSRNIKLLQQLNGWQFHAG